MLVLTKPLGTGIITTALKRKIGKASLIDKAVKVMKELNVAGAVVAEAGLVRGGIVAAELVSRPGRASHP